MVSNTSRQSIHDDDYEDFVQFMSFLFKRLKRLFGLIVWGQIRSFGSVHGVGSAMVAWPETSPGPHMYALFAEASKHGMVRVHLSVGSASIR